MSKHTPGPWLMQIAANGTLEILSNYSGDVVARAGSRVIAESVKNSLLIAAAPELLEALEQIANSYPTTDEGECLAAIARDAIAKARGEA